MKPAAITVGRFNPLTRGHEYLIKLLRIEAAMIGARPVVFIVDGYQTGKDLEKNPLNGDYRVWLTQKAFPEVKVDIISTAYEAVEVLWIQDMYPKVWLAGSDRAPGYRKILTSEKIDGRVIEVNREAGEAEGVSATIAREAARANDLTLFKSLMPSSLEPNILADVMRRIREANDGNRSICTTSTK